ncbi:TonB-dependent receptor plug domain-containing protein [Aliikangiella coralliicola]|uniref:TonB-dependent receptor n=1 Tax=Aliikangiella coralliicola TaxID=2592383 RepID=A0A545UD58_9GAMM|nr:TonB-dependent receptor [Aliikangiella coralliicola]TQV87404.1 hypothetical protein FLL46_13245 [Aliikangiella coralliicola]
MQCTTNALLATALYCLSSIPAHCAEQQKVNLLDMSLEELMNIKINTATKNTQEATKTPAIVSVITHEDILAWGYQSVAEALQQVPGLYGINDYARYNYGVRGINGGQRAYNKILKVMINGTAVSFRSDSTNFLGPELLPIEIVERIEVVRGPGSALYGENAFMGIVNIITRPAEKNAQQQYRLRLGKNQHMSVSAVLSEKQQNWSFIIAANGEKANNDGLTLPSTSPKADDFTGLSSDNSETLPESFFSQWIYQSGDFTHELLINYSHLDTVAEFLDFGTLSHENRIALNQQLTNYKLAWKYSQNLEAHLNFSFTRGKPSSDEKLSLNSPVSFPKREFEFEVFDFSSEIHYQSNNQSAYIFGVDFANDQESLIQISSVDSTTGDITLLSTPTGKVTLKNVGAYVQYLNSINKDTLLTLNLRSDDHNIYGTNTNYRFGLVKQFSKPISAKFLFGSSYKAPAAMQLYAQPLYPGEIIGNANLSAEKADTVEAEVSWLISAKFALNLSLWLNQIDNKVELLPQGANVQPTNSGKQEGKGLESELKWIDRDFSLIANFAYQNTDNKTNTLFQGTQVAPTAMYPRLTSHIRFQYQFSNGDTIGISTKYASERRATNSNIRENLLQPYQLEAYSLFNFSYLTTWNALSLQLNINNLFDEDYAEPGFVGIDIPGKSRSWYLNLRYEL